MTHAIRRNTANLVVHLRDGASAECAFVPARAAGSTLQVAQLVARRHALQVGPLDELQVECALHNLFNPLDVFKRSITVLANIRISEQRKLRRFAAVVDTITFLEVVDDSIVIKCNLE